MLLTTHFIFFVNVQVAAAAASVSSSTFHSSASDGAAALSTGQPSVMGILSPAAVPDSEVERKHIIGSRKPVAKKSGVSITMANLLHVQIDPLIVNHFWLLTMLFFLMTTAWCQERTRSSTCQD